MPPIFARPFLLPSFFLLIFLLSGFVGFSQTTAIPDRNFEQALIDLGYDSGTSDGSVPTVNIAGITSLNVSNKSISSLVGIEAFTALTSLVCHSNSLTTLDVSANTALTDLSCSSNSLTTLDVSANTALTDLSCSFNDLTTLDVSANTALTDLSCSSNELTTLNVKNGNNTNFNSFGSVARSFDAISNPNLGCIQVDDATYSATNWPNIDATAYFSEDCSVAVATVSTTDADAVMATSATLGGEVTADGGAVVTEKGVVYSATNTAPEIDGAGVTKEENSATTDTFSASITGLTGGTTYYFKAYAINRAGTSYGAVKSFMTAVALAVDDFETAGITISPNPTSGMLNIAVNEKAGYSLSNTGGKILEKGTLASGKNEIDISHLSDDLYFLNIETSRGRFTSKVVKD